MPTGDSDSDGIRNSAQFFFGLSPVLQDTNRAPVLTIQYDSSAGTVAIDFNRARTAASQPYTLQYSTDLETWMPTPNTTEQVLTSDNLHDRLRLLLPVPTPDAAFFRLQIPFP